MATQPHRSERALRFGILGPLRVEVGDDEVRLDSPNQRAILAALLIDAGTVVPTDRLAEVVWGGDQPGDPVGATQTHVSRLRKLLTHPGGPPARDLLVTHAGGYRLAVHPERIDARRFERLVGGAHAASQPHSAIDLIGQALALWRGPPLFEFDHLAATTEAARLEELRLAALELRAESLLGLERHHELVAELESLVARHPLREQLRGHLMAALYRCGRQADALAAYRDLRQRLVAELGVEPSLALRELERRILQQAGDLSWPAARPGRTRRGGRPGPAGGPAAAAAPGAEPTRLVGRVADIAGVAAAVRREGLVVLTGVGGVGKSRLARHVARLLAEDHPDGVVLCDLLEAEDGAAVADLVAATLQVLPSTGGGPADRLVQHLCARRVLLVLDNCEHVLAATSALVEQIRRRCPRVAVLVTSRRPLQVAGQQIWPVAPLDTTGRGPGSAVELFCDRAALADPTFGPTGPDLETVAEICRRLDGIPLAVELAAAQVRAMGPADIARRLQQSSGPLAAASAVPSTRHHSMQAVLDRSYGLLPGTTRAVFDRLAVFSGGFELAAAGRVCSGAGVSAALVADHVAELVDHSMVTVERSGSHVRYRLLESARAYGMSHLEDRGELPVWRHRHAQDVSHLAERAAQGLQGPDEAGWVHVLDRELANLRAAHRWACDAGQVGLALRLSGALRLYAYHRLRDEVYDWALRALALPGAPEHAAYPAAALTAAVGHMQRGDLGRAHERAAQALSMASGRDDQVVPALQVLAEIALYRGRLEEADRLGAELGAAARTRGWAYHQALGSLYRVHAAAYGGRRADASAHLEEGWRAVDETGNPTLRAGYSYLEGETRLDAEPEVALAALHRAVEIAGPVGNRFLTGVARVAIASLAARHGEPTAALGSFRTLIDHWRACGDGVHLWTTLHNLVVLLQRVGADEAAAVLLAAAGTATTGASAFGSDAQRLDAAAAALVRSLGETSFATAWTRGRTMSDDEAVTCALGELDRLLAAAPVAPGGAAP